MAAVLTPSIHGQGSSPRGGWSAARTGRRTPEHDVRRAQKGAPIRTLMTEARTLMTDADAH